MESKAADITPARQGKKVLYLIICASTAASAAENLLRQAQIRNWDVCVLSTPSGRNFFDIPTFERLSGHPVRSEYKHPSEPDILPRAEAIVVYPATFNTINKWASGISDTLAVGILCEYMGLGYPIIAVPCVRTGGGLDTHPAFLRNIDLLKSCGANVMYQPKTYPPSNRIPPEILLDALDDMMKQKDSTEG